MKYIVAVANGENTLLYLMEEELWVRRRDQARVFDSREEAEEKVARIVRVIALTEETEDAC